MTFSRQLYLGFFRVWVLRHHFCVKWLHSMRHQSSRARPSIKLARKGSGACDSFLFTVIKWVSVSGERGGWGTWGLSNTFPPSTPAKVSLILGSLNFMAGKSVLCLCKKDTNFYGRYMKDIKGSRFLLKCYIRRGQFGPQDGGLLV